jgi:hypothetical protein
MKYRNVVLQDNLTITTAATSIYDINLADVISRLQFKFNITNHATTPVIIAHPARAVTKIEVIDGSHVIASISGEQLMSMNYYDHGRAPYSYINGVTATDSIFNCNLDFGRWLWDPELAFDPKRYMNPQLRVTYNKALYESSSSAMYMTITADVFDEKSISPKGYIKRHQITTWTPAANTREYIDLPTDFPIRALFATGYATDQNVRAPIYEMKLTEDAGKKVPLDSRTRHTVAQIMSDYAPIIEPVIFVGQAATEVIYTMPSYDCQFVGLSTGNEVIFLTSYTADTLTVDSATGANRVEGIARGWIPFHTLPLFFGDKNDISDWYDTSNIKNLELQTLGAATIGTSPVGRVFLEQFVPF